MSRITLQRDNSSGCLRLQSHGRVPTSILCSMYDNHKSLSDVSLTGAAPTGDVCNLQPIQAHKNILAHASPHLFDLFTVQGFVDSNKSAYTITSIDHNSLCSIIKFIYTDNVEVEEDDAAERIRGILIGAKYLIMTDLADACETFLASSDQSNVNNCIDLFQFAFKYKCTKILSAVCAFIAENLLAVSQSIKFLCLSQDECAKFLLSEPVVAANADDRCRAAIAWLNHESPSRAGSAECIMSMTDLNAAGVSPETLLLAAQNAVIRPVINGFALNLIDAMAGNIRRLSHIESVQKQHKLGEARNEAWYVVGGKEDGEAFYRYDVPRREWSTLPNLSWRRWSAGVCAIGKRIIVMGGKKGGSCPPNPRVSPKPRVSSTIDEYDTIKQTWSASEAKLGRACEHVAAAADSKYAYAFGGYSPSKDTAHDAAELYSVKSKTLEVLTHMDSNRFGAAAVCKDDDMVFVVGGFSKVDSPVGNGLVTTYCPTIARYGHASKTWSKIATLEDSRSSMGAAFVGDDLYIAGGCSSKKVEVFNAETGQVRVCGAELGRIRYGCSAVPLDQHVMCVVGGYSPAVNKISVEVYDTREGKWSVGVIVPDMPKALSYFGFAHVRP